MKSRWDNQREFQKVAESCIGMKLTSKEIKAKFGYSPNTFILDTKLYQKDWLEVVPDTNPIIYEIVKGRDLFERVEVSR